MIQMLTIAAVLGSLAAPLAAQEAAVAQEKPAMVKEPETGILFPSFLQAPQGEKSVRQDLLGLGAREKTIFKINVYAMGLYVDLAAALPVLKKAVGEKTLKQAKKDKAFHAAFLNDDFGKTLRWVMARDVDGADIAEAFQDSLEPRIKAAKLDAEQRAAAEAAVRTLRAYFTSELTEGTELVFHWETGGRFHTTVGGVKNGVITNLALCRAMFDIYLGADPISSTAKTRFLEGAYTHLHPQSAAAR